MTVYMTRKEFEEIAKDALDELPKEFADKLQNVDVVIQHEIAHHFGISDKCLRDLGIY
ncbi:MAG: metallopeptidase family protein [Candidatus Omnitrophica bacterium]|nr:metallopeptidase family protein [Candidatus Omnitrophota bacterium]